MKRFRILCCIGISLFSICQAAKAQTVSETTVRAKINEFLPDNNVRFITPAKLREVLDQMVNLINRKVNNEQITVSQDGKSIKIKPAGIDNQTIRPIELYSIFRPMSESPTAFTFHGKPLFEKRVALTISQTNEVFLTGIDKIYEIDGQALYDQNGITKTTAVNYHTTSPYILHSANSLTALNFECDACTNKRYELILYYTKQ